MTVTTLKKRSEYLRVRGGGRWSTPAFIVEAKARELTSGTGEAGEQHGVPAARFGFTITKKIGNAVARNRIRRRLKEAVRKMAQAVADPGCDYVFVARKPALAMDFAVLCNEVGRAMEQASKRAGPVPKPLQRKIEVPQAHHERRGRDEVPLPLGGKNRQTDRQSRT